LIDFSGWVTIDNNSGKRYKNASLKLIAGDVNIVQPPTAVYRPMMMMAKTNAMAGNAAPAFSEKSFADYHMDTLDKRVDVSENQRKQIEFIPKAENVTISKYYLVSISAGGNAETGLKAQSNIRFVNSKDNSMGMALPKGTIRVFKEDDDQALEFIGEDSIDHTPKD